ncbi:MAG: RdgB/HAM1 family non-canonical purine NTP pyrophosphatase [bacterium]
MKLLVATGNRHKFSEISAILKSTRLVMISLREWGDVPQVVEDGDTFEVNAIKKAVTLARFSGLWTLADDSGLEVEALGGEPGVVSARYAGEPSNDAANNDKLLRKMRGVVDRSARFRCVIALSDPNGVTRTVSGTCEGTLRNQLQGEGGFGYDPLFVPCGHDLTFAEISADIKNGLSHRAMALARAVQEWGGILASEPGRWPD